MKGNDCLDSLDLDCLAACAFESLLYSVILAVYCIALQFPCTAQGKLYVINRASSEFVGLDKGTLSLACNKDTFRSRLLGGKLMTSERRACYEVKIVVEDPWCACSDKWRVQYLQSVTALAPHTSLVWQMLKLVTLCWWRAALCLDIGLSQHQVRKGAEFFEQMWVMCFLLCCKSWVALSGFMSY